MDDSLLSSPAVREHKPGMEWKTPERSKIRGWRAERKSYGQIMKMCGTRDGKPLITRSTIQKIVKAPRSKRQRANKATKKKILKLADIQRVLRFVSASWHNRRLSYARLVVECKLKCKTTTLRRSLKAVGYRRCVACRRPFISKKQAEKRLAFALKYRWWSVEEHWKHVAWSDEATFETGKRGKIWVMRRPEEKNCRDCIQSVYRSGRVSVMIWAAIGWDWKSELVLLTKEPGKKGFCSTAYTNQVLDAVIGPHYASLSLDQKEKFISMEDGAKVHQGAARLWRLNHGIKGFNWPPSSPDLNPIEKVRRWMKYEIKKLDSVPTSIEDMKEVLRELWAEVKPEDWRYLTHRLTCKLENVIGNKGMATIH
jgi:transposase